MKFKFPRKSDMVKKEKVVIPAFLFYLSEI